MAASGGGGGPACRKGNKAWDPQRVQLSIKVGATKKTCLCGKMPSAGWEGKVLPGEFNILQGMSHANSNHLQGNEVAPDQKQPLGELPLLPSSHTVPTSLFLLSVFLNFGGTGPVLLFF